jgi:hypothetical protein
VLLASQILRALPDTPFCHLQICQQYTAFHHNSLGTSGRRALTYDMAGDPVMPCAGIAERP